MVCFNKREIGKDCVSQVQTYIELLLSGSKEVQNLGYL